MTDLWTKLSKISGMDEGEIRAAIGKMPYGDVAAITDLQDSEDDNDRRFITFLLKKYRDAPLSEWQIDGEYPYAFTSLDAQYLNEVFDDMGVKYKRVGDDFHVQDWRVVEAVVKKNPIARDMAVNAGKYRPKVTPSKKEKELKKDPWDRGAKRKDRKMDEINESVMGLTNIQSINRVRALAGLPGVKEMETPELDVEPLPTDVVDDLPDMDPVFGDELPDLRPAVSDAMTDIQNSINNIQRRLSDIRMGEYKTIVKKLDDLQNQVRAMGADYLGGE